MMAVSNPPQVNVGVQTAGSGAMGRSNSYSTNPKRQQGEPNAQKPGAA
jgi:hypothetical protein